MPRRLVHRSDANSAALVKAARKLGMLVYYIGRPVDCFGYVQGRWTPIEVKSAKGTYTEDQKDFIAECVNRNAPLLTWRTLADVVACANGAGR